MVLKLKSENKSLIIDGSFLIMHIYLLSSIATLMLRSVQQFRLSNIFTSISAKGMIESVSISILIIQPIRLMKFSNIRQLGGFRRLRLFGDYFDFPWEKLNQLSFTYNCIFQIFSQFTSRSMKI